MSVVGLIALVAVIVIGGTAGFALYLGKRVKTTGDWIVAGRSLPLYVVVFTQYATAVGGGVLVAHVGIGYAWGWSDLTYIGLVCLGLMIFVIMAKWLREQGFSTVPDIFEKLYGKNKLVRGFAALMTIFVPFGWLCTQLVAFAKLFSGITGASIPTLIMIFAIISILYVLPAGLLSVAWTDFILGVFMLIWSIIALIFAHNMAGGWQAVVANVPENIRALPEGLWAVGWYTIALWIIAVFLGTLTNQLYYQRIFAIRDIKHVRKSLVLSALVVLTSGIWASLMGLFIRAMNPGFSVAERELAAGWFLQRVPTWFLAVYSAFLLGTILTTVDSSIHSVVSNLVKDIYQEIINPEAEDKKLLLLSRVLTVIITLFAAALAILWPEALGWLVLTYALSAAALFVPIWVGYALKDKYKWMLTPQAALVSMIAGIIGASIAYSLNTSIPYAAYGVALSLVGFLATGYITGRKNVSST